MTTRDPRASSSGDGDHAMRPFRKLDTAKRRSAGVVYLVMAGGAAAITMITGITLLWLTAVVPLVALAGYQFLGGWRIKVSDMDAITLAGDSASFDPGHGSATLGFVGLRARPVWQVLIFGDGPSPQHQALVTIDAVTGEVTGVYEESVEMP